MSAENLESSSRKALKDYLRKYADGRYRNSVVEFLPDTGAHLIFVQGSVQPFTEKAKTMLIRRVMSDLGLPIEVAQFSAKTDTRSSAALAQVLEPLLGDNLIEIGVSTPTPASAEVIVFVHDLRRTESGDLHKRVVTKVTEFLKPYELRLEKFFFNELADGVPSGFQILRLIYTHAPVDLAVLSEKLTGEQTPAPSENWLKRQLDSLLRSNKIMWQPPGSYVATSEGIADLPARKGRTSPDIARALAMGKRAW